MDQTKTVVDAVSGFAVLISFLPYLPAIISAIAALLSAVWYIIRIYEYIKEKRTPGVSSE